ncbi:MAG: DUF411 domain-containing protein [Gemmatimonadaceae bacterium]
MSLELSRATVAAAAEPLSRRRWLAAAAASLLSFLEGPPAFAAGGLLSPRMTVHKDRECSCCNGWVAHVRRAGFDVRVVDASSRAALAVLKDELGIPPSLRSCHTAVIAAASRGARSYLLEGHVPAGAIYRLLRERPVVLGLAVPGMPSGPPGMELPGDAPGPATYDVLSFRERDAATLFGRYPIQRG